MRAFFETTFGPTELSIVETVFNELLSENGVAKSEPEAELAAAIIINLFREGNDNGYTLTAAVAGHMGLADLKMVSTLDDIPTCDRER